MSVSKMAINPERDLVLERVVDVPRELVGKAWTRPEMVKQWFPARPGRPWTARSTFARAGPSGR
jgi:uncharacterized protein YndB with AHSA1/START domain